MGVDLGGGGERVAPGQDLLVVRPVVGLGGGVVALFDGGVVCVIVQEGALFLQLLVLLVVLLSVCAAARIYWHINLY